MSDVGVYIGISVLIEGLSYTEKFFLNRRMIEDFARKNNIDLANNELARRFRIYRNLPFPLDLVYGAIYVDPLLNQIGRS